MRLKALQTLTYTSNQLAPVFYIWGDQVASVTGWMGDGLQGSSCSPPQSPNPVINFGKPFGHAHIPDLEDLLAHCTCSIYNARTSFNVSTLSSSHEVVFIYYRLVCDVNGREYQVRMRAEKGGSEILYMTSNFTWNSAWSYYQGFMFFGWTPCWWWEGGSNYDPNYVEITDNGTDYEAFVELWDTVTSTKVAEYSQTFTITGLSHTVMTGNIENYAGQNVKGDIRIRSECTVDSAEKYQNRALDDDYSYSIIVDGMEGNVRITPYHSGYQLKEVQFTGITDKNLNTGNDFDGTDYLPASIQGTVYDSDSIGVENANVWAERSGVLYGAKTASDGKYALPLHTLGTYTPYAVKNNFDIQTGSDVTQPGYHPSTPTTRNLTISRKGDPTGASAQVDMLCVDDRSVVILDDPVTVGTLIKPNSVGATVVKAKTRKWGTGAAQGTTSTGTSNGGVAYGSGGRNYDGDTGDARNWE